MQGQGTFRDQSRGRRQNDLLEIRNRFLKNSNLIVERTKRKTVPPKYLSLAMEKM